MAARWPLAFMKAVDDLKGAANLQRVIAAVTAGDIGAAMSALHLDAAAYGPVLDAIQGGYTEAGQGAAAYFPPLKTPSGVAMVVRFDVRNLRAEAWLRQNSSRLVTRILSDQRAAIRSRLQEGLSRGDNPTTTALNIVGRINPATRKREGGIIGLTAQQTGYVANARAELTSGDAAQLRNYLNREQRDRRYDGAVKQAISGKQPMTVAMADKAARSYENRLLKLRGNTIGRTETLTALRAAKHEAYKQAVDAGGVSGGGIRRTWRDAGDGRVRHSHSVMDGETVGMDEPFTAPSGAKMMYPGDTTMGAGPEETVNCRCDVDYRVDFLANIR
jgi:hypothetical protein